MRNLNYKKQNPHKKRVADLARKRGKNSARMGANKKTRAVCLRV